MLERRRPGLLLHAVMPRQGEIIMRDKPNLKRYSSSAHCAELLAHNTSKTILPGKSVSLLLRIWWLGFHHRRSAATGDVEHRPPQAPWPLNAPIGGFRLDSARRTTPPATQPRQSAWGHCGNQEESTCSVNVYLLFMRFRDWRARASDRDLRRTGRASRTRPKVGPMPEDTLIRQNQRRRPKFPREWSGNSHPT
jgi:hypothetical protein